MKRGRFLGFAPNVSDGFRYLILTELSFKTEMPRILARSVLKPRYTNEQHPYVFTRAEDRKLVFYQNDGKTPLPDTETESDCNLVDPLNLKTESQDQDNLALDDRYGDYIEESLGPQLKQQRLNSSVNLAPTTLITSITQYDDDNSVVAPVEGIIATESPNMTNTPIPQPDVEMIHLEAPFNGDVVDDGQIHGLITDTPDDDTPIVSKDDDVKPDVTEEVSFELENMADGYQSSDNSLKIVYHEFKHGILHFI